MLNRVTSVSVQLPPDDLVFLVAGHRNVEHWGRSRRACVTEVILPRLADLNIHPAQFRSILDFGCGCGRVLAGWEGLHGSAKLYGVDINPQLVAFCQENIPFATVSECGRYPPLDFNEASFDFVYACSVWTHMKVSAAVQWAGEMARVIAPGGILMMSYQGSAYRGVLASITKDGSRILEEAGIYVHCHVDGASEGSNHYATFLTSDFVRSVFRGFELLAIHPGVCGPSHFAADQDIAIFRRTAAF